MPKYTAIVLSAGIGSRMGSRVHKQYLLLQGRPVLYYTLKAFEDSPVDEVILVVGKGEASYCKNEIIDKYQIQKVTQIAEGGKERYHSVFNGLAKCGQTDYVLIHDGARPLVSREVIERGMKEVIQAEACIAGVPVKDTVKIVDGSQTVKSTPQRSTLWSIQTPQVFSYETIHDAYEKMMADGNENITDDAMAVEQYGSVPVHVFEGSYDNIKITTPEDLRMAEVLLQRPL